MNCINFFEGDLAEKISCSQANRNTTLFFLHIPKTAGTSAQRDLNYAFPEGIHIPQESKEHHWNATLEKL
ncbi:MAG: hypothetical protein VX438_04075, partial [Planctomycetota bacterium]|nr:hypothetical protein [Planctomycetota bacterium]